MYVSSRTFNINSELPVVPIAKLRQTLRILVELAIQTTQVSVPNTPIKRDTAMCGSYLLNKSIVDMSNYIKDSSIDHGQLDHQNNKQNGKNMQNNNT